MSAIQSTRKVANPKLTLYAFHLRNSLDQGSQATVENSDRLWETCQQIGQKLGIFRLESLIERLRKQWGSPIGLPLDNPDSQYLELLPQERLLHFSEIPNGSSPKLTGEVYPLQIHDTYFVDITLRYPYPNVEVSQLNDLNPQGCLLPHNIQASLGQTLMLFAQPLEEIDNPQSLAEVYLQAILPESEVEALLLSPPATGQLLGSPIFAYENNQDDPTQHNHILIWLNSHPQTEAREEKINYYQPLVNLLCSRSKILYAYAASGCCNAQAREIYSRIEQHIHNFTQIVQSPSRLQEFKRLLTELPEISLQYGQYLRDLEDHKNTIRTNLANYQIWLKKLETLPDCELRFLQEFSDLADKKFQQQIQVHQSFLTPGQLLFRELIDNIRGLVAIDQIESDRQFQQELQKREEQFQQALQQQEKQWQEQWREQDENSQKREQNLEMWIAAVGTGLAVSGVSSQVNPKPIEAILGKTAPNVAKPSYLSELSYTAGNIVIHIFLGLVIALIVRAVFKITS